MKETSQLVVLERIRITLNLLRKSNVLSQATQIENSIPFLLNELQGIVRYGEGNGDSHTIFLPFLRVLQMQNLASPYIRVAIESIEIFFAHGVIDDSDRETIGTTLTNIVETITSCKFVHTDSAGDEIVRVKMFDTLLKLLLDKTCAAHLSANTLWTIFTFSCETMIKSSGKGGSYLLYQGAERTVNETISCCLVRQASPAIIASKTNTADSGSGVVEDDGLWEDGTSTSGVPALCAIVQYFIDVVNAAAADHSAHPAGATAAAAAGTTPAESGGGSSSNAGSTAGGNGGGAGGSSVAPSGMPRSRSSSAGLGSIGAGSNSGGSSGGSGGGMTKNNSGNLILMEHNTHELSQEKRTLHLIFVVHSLSQLLRMSGGTTRQLLLRSRTFSQLVTDDLGLAVLRLCSARSRPLPVAVMQGLLSVFGTLLVVAGPCVRILVECFFRQVYLKALMQMHADLNIELQYQAAVSKEEIVSPFADRTAKGTAGASVDNSNDLAPIKPARLLEGKNSGSGAGNGAYEGTDNFRMEELEAIFESLCDVLSDRSLVPMLYVSFDCSPTSIDIVQPLVQYICRCCSLVLTFYGEFMTGYYKEGSVLVIQIFKQIIQTLQIRCQPTAIASSSAAAATAAAAVDAASAPSSSSSSSSSYLHTRRGALLMEVMKASRCSKRFLSEAAKLFVGKPALGLDYLVRGGALPSSPMQPAHVATFLRIAPDLPKDAVGAFLGELGKDNFTNECDSKEFHAQLLLAYVSSFEFSDQSVLDCLRIFLSAFRLPGEAQQIDRILGAFSERCYAQSIDGKTGVVENAEVTYVLAFAIIMLNTDRHNPNIRADRKMTREQFIRNNTNYGRDVNQTVPLTKEYLSGIYSSISEFPIRTDNHELAATVSTEVWKDLQMQASADPRKTILVTMQHKQQAFLRGLQSLYSSGHDSSNAYEGEKADVSSEKEMNNAVPTTTCSSSSSIINDNSIDGNNGLNSVAVEASASLRAFLYLGWGPLWTAANNNMPSASADSISVSAAAAAESEGGEASAPPANRCVGAIARLLLTAAGKQPTLLDPLEMSLELLADDDDESTVHNEEEGNRTTAGTGTGTGSTPTTGGEGGALAVAGIFDADLMQCIWKDLYRVCLCVHVHNALIMRSVMNSEIEQEGGGGGGGGGGGTPYLESRPERGPTMLKHGQLKRLLGVSNELLVDFLKVSLHHGLNFVLDGVNLTLTLCAGMIQGSLQGKLLSFLQWEEEAAEEDDEGLPRSDSSLGAIFSLQEDGMEKYDGVITESAVLLYQFRHFESARSSACALLSVIQNFQSHVTNWSIVWYFLGGLRDCALLPKELVVEEPVEELLPPNVRNEFEASLLEVDRKVFQSTRPRPPRIVRRQSSSLLSLQGLGEAIFGSSGTSGTSVDINRDDESGVANETGEIDFESLAQLDGESALEIENYKRDVAYFQNMFKLDALSARWDAGYEGLTSSPNTPVPPFRPVGSSDGISDGGSGVTAPVVAAAADGRGSGAAAIDTQNESIPAFSILDGGMTVADLRLLFAGSGVLQLVSDTRFLSEEKLEVLFKFLVAAVEVKSHPISGNSSGGTDAGGGVLQMKLGSWSSANSALVEDFPHQEAMTTPMSLSGLSASLPIFSSHIDRATQSINKSVSLFNRALEVLQSKHSLSSSTVAWLEMVLVDVSLRNRDRFAAFWPILKHHYIRVLSGPTVTLSYLTERRVLGLLKICTRMISRDFLAGTILELLGRIFTRPVHAPTSSSLFTDSNKDEMSNDSTATSTAIGSSGSSYPPMPGVLLMQLASQIAAAMWKVLTLNVELLPLLPLEQWQTLFTIISISSSGGSFAAIKSFESMAWLLHEPRLIAKVPVFCIISVRPLLRNANAPLSVSIGAVHLLSHLHSRLEVLIKDAPGDGAAGAMVDQDYDNGSLDDDETPVLWESCWIPILKGMADGVADRRVAVREAAAAALCQAVLDRHAHVVPAGLLVDVLGNIIAPTVVQLRDHCVDAVNRHCSPLPSVTAVSPAQAPAQAPTQAPAGAVVNLVPVGRPMGRLYTSGQATMLSEQQHDQQQDQQWVSVDGASPSSASSSSSHCAADSVTVHEMMSSIDVSILEVSTVMTGNESDNSGDASAIAQTLMALCNSFLLHVKRMVGYPSFDKLWLNILSVIGQFIDLSPHQNTRGGGSRIAQSFEHVASQWLNLTPETQQQARDLYRMTHIAKDQLVLMLRVMKTEQIFAKKHGLLIVTRETLQSFEGCVEYTAELP